MILVQFEGGGYLPIQILDIPLDSVGIWSRVPNEWPNGLWNVWDYFPNCFKDLNG